jgi:hypothetical protein
MQAYMSTLHGMLKKVQRNLPLVTRQIFRGARWRPNGQSPEPAFSRLWRLAISESDATRRSIIQ